VFNLARDPWKLYLLEPEYGSLGHADFHAWPLLEGRYLLCLLFEYAGTLGLFDLAYRDPAGARDDFRGNWGSDELDALSRYDGLPAARLNALGTYVFGLTPTYQPATEGLPSGCNGAGGRVLKVLSNHDVVAAGDLAAGEKLVLDAYARRSSDRVWSLAMDTLLAALQAGRSLRELAAFLETARPPRCPPP
jgi:ABC-type amino acid transport substrate-binding protein